jgi:hypothetical protein
MNISEVFGVLSTIHGKIAEDVYPKGVSLKCPVCGREIHATTRDCAVYLKQGWPKCCGKTMRTSVPKEAAS